jgi:DNA-binding MarR family transcriptional regulator
MILGPIWNSEGCSQKECGEIATKDKTAVTRIINSLEEKNLVVRVLDQIDKRIKRIVLTKKGEKLFDDILPIIEKTRFHMNNDISEDELKTLDIVLKKLINNHESIKKKLKDDIRSN